MPGASLSPRASPMTGLAAAAQERPRGSLGYSTPAEHARRAACNGICPLLLQAGVS